MNLLSRVSIAIKAGRELGVGRMADYAAYQLLLRSGYFYWRVKDGSWYTRLPREAFGLSPVLRAPDAGALRDLLGAEGQAQLIAEADEIVAGRVRLFGGEPVDLDLGPAESEMHWTVLEHAGSPTERDIKLVWEPARFGWAFILGRAYRVSGDERYPAAFWGYLERFLGENPAYFGQQWRSAQEAALRLIALVFAGTVFADSRSSNPERMTNLGRAIAVHAGRIPATMAYARAQNNNHLLVEAVGLYTASCALPHHPAAKSWGRIGWDWAHRALRNQINADGVYIQHSLNYHRLMLQAALWLFCLAGHRGDAFPPESLERLQAATCWLSALIDRESGCGPNLGPNDGSQILPLSNAAFRDFRPTLQAAAGGFCRERAFAPGRWDETALWLGVRLKGAPSTLCQCVAEREEPLVLRSKHSWGYLRAARFTARPGHADQLHFDLWWQGFNIAQDAGTYLYNAAPPWDNALARSLVHNTVTVNHRDQMTWAGRFLWLDWAQAEDIRREKAADVSRERISATHNGYRHLGVTHRREATLSHPDHWLVEDHLYYVGREKKEGDELDVRLHWLLPDWSWEINPRESGVRLGLNSPGGEIWLDVSWELNARNEPTIQLARAGQALYGRAPVSPVVGWVSPTYGVRQPALSFAITIRTRLPLRLISEWTFPKA